MCVRVRLLCVCVWGWQGEKFVSVGGSIFIGGNLQSNEGKLIRVKIAGKKKKKVKEGAEFVCVSQQERPDAWVHVKINVDFCPYRNVRCWFSSTW